MITIVTQCSLDRLKQLNNMCLTWNGIISVSVYVPQKNNENDVISNRLEELEDIFNNCENNNNEYKCILDIHLLYSYYNINNNRKKEEWYPIK